MIRDSGLRALDCIARIADRPLATALLDALDRVRGAMELAARNANAHAGSSVISERDVALALGGCVDRAKMHAGLVLDVQRRPWPYGSNGVAQHQHRAPEPARDEEEQARRKRRRTLTDDFAIHSRKAEDASEDIVNADEDEDEDEEDEDSDDDGDSAATVEEPQPTNLRRSARRSVKAAAEETTMRITRQRSVNVTPARRNSTRSSVASRQRDAGDSDVDSSRVDDSASTGSEETVDRALLTTETEFVLGAQVNHLLGCRGRARVYTKHASLHTFDAGVEERRYLKVETAHAVQRGPVQRTVSRRPRCSKRAFSARSAPQRASSWPRKCGRSWRRRTSTRPCEARSGSI